MVIFSILLKNHSLSNQNLPVSLRNSEFKTLYFQRLVQFTESIPEFSGLRNLEHGLEDQIRLLSFSVTGLICLLASRTYDNHTETIFYRSHRKIDFQAEIERSGFSIKKEVLGEIHEKLKISIQSVTKTFFAALNCRDIVDYYFDIIKEISNLQLEDNELSILATLFLLDSSKLMTRDPYTRADRTGWHQKFFNLRTAPSPENF